MTPYTRRDFLRSTGLVAAASLVPSRVYAEEGTLTGRVTDLISGDPIRINITLVNELTGEVFKTKTGSTQTAVEELTWGQVKSRRDFLRVKKPTSLEEGVYSILVPAGTYTVAITDNEISSAKAVSNDLFTIQYDIEKDHVPRAFMVDIKGNISTSCNERIFPKNFDLPAYVAIAMREGKIVRFRDVENIDYQINPIDLSTGKRRNDEFLGMAATILKYAVGMISENQGKRINLRDDNIRITDNPSFSAAISNKFKNASGRDSFVVFSSTGDPPTGRPSKKTLEANGYVHDGTVTIPELATVGEWLQEFFGAFGLHGEYGDAYKSIFADGSRLGGYNSKINEEGIKSMMPIEDLIIVLAQASRLPGSIAPDTTPYVINR